MVGGILYEHGHRMIASFVGLLTIILTIWLWKKEERRWVKLLGITALGAVIAQGLLGGLTVVFLLPTAISVSHATLAQTFFVIVSSIALFTSRWWQTDYPKLSQARTFAHSSFDSRNGKHLHPINSWSTYAAYRIGACCPRFSVGIWTDISVAFA